MMTQILLGLLISLTAALQPAPTLVRDAVGTLLAEMEAGGVKSNVPGVAPIMLMPVTNDQPVVNDPLWARSSAWSPSAFDP